MANKWEIKMPEYEVIKITIVEIKPAILKALCPCGGGGKSDWIIKPDHAVCSWCGRKLSGDFYAVGRALHGCGGGGESDWLIGTDRVVCTWCGKTWYTDGRVTGIAKRAALCSCGGGGKSDWFITENGTWICSWCGKKR